MTPDPLPRWHTPRRNSRNLARGEAPSPDDWNPLAKSAAHFKDAMKERGIQYDLDVSTLLQKADRTDSGKESMGTLLWELTGDWKLVSSPDFGDGYVAWNLFGGGGINYDADSQTLSENVGSTSTLNFADVQDDPLIVDELFWKQRMKDGDLTLIAGKVDMSYHFDTNRLANNPYSQFNAFALVNNLSIPFPTYGGFGGIVRNELTDWLYFMGGMGDSSQTSAVSPFTTVDNDSWYQLFELGATLNWRGRGKGIYRITPWHNNLFGEDGWGIGLSVDQDVIEGRLRAFLRYGLADDDVSPVEEFYSAGVAFERPFDQPKDRVAIGIARSNPSAAGARNETLFELYYQRQLSPSLVLTPNLQTVFDPAFASDDDTVLIAGLRLTLHL